MCDLSDNLRRKGLRVALVGALLGGCGEAATGSPAKAARPTETAAPLRVGVTRLEPATLERRYRTSGTLHAVREATITAKEPGILLAVLVQEGDVVREGQPLARLDGRELALQAASSRLQADHLERELRRLESASAAVIAREEIDKQRYAVEEARMLAALTGVKARQSTVRAPFTGTIVERSVDEGNLATTATPLFRLADLATLQLHVHLPERDALAVAHDVAVDLRLVDGTTFVGRILRRAPIVDPLTGTVKFTLQADQFPAHAMPGAFVRAELLVGRREDAPSLPRSAVFTVEGQPHVFVVEQGRARRRAIEIGLEGEQRVEVVAGVTPDDPVVLEGNAGITEGMPLAPAGPPDASAPPREGARR
ncbi:MAG TPA: efflux RND transporter periplasmic adaptor subunit [Microbacterium sp.]|nr:efflux RND transporter periplasmic adaptor subunit [Microbacterium sp.]